MTMRYKKCLLQAVLITTWISISYGCQMEGVSTWFTPVTTTVLDTHSGSFFNRATTNIVGINSITYGEGLNSGPYVQVTHSNSEFDITTNDVYQSYEENETAQSMTFTVVFGCTGGSTGTLVFIIDVIDTNNNPPQFLPNDQFEFTLTPPLPPGYQITGCLQDITVRDIDLTTQRIEFAIEPNDYFEIDYDASLSTNPKEFKAILRTTTFLRTLPESLELVINATDVDLTGDPPITTSAIIRIVADDEFQLPEEPVFSQPYYLARYADNQVTMDETITLQQGFDELVQFSLEGDHSRYFNLQTNGNNLSLAVIEPLSLELLREGQLILAVRAEREFTSGATATFVVQMPEVLGLRFENTLYESRIVDATMEPLQMVLAQGFEEGFSVSVTGDSSALFTTTVQDDTVTLSLSAPSNPIEHSFISLEVFATNEFSTASAVVTLEVIRDDVVTPAFEMAIYRGSYEPESGLTLEQIVLVQGYDETVSFSLDGEHASYFEVAQSGPVVSVTASSLPPLVLSEGSILLSLRATKPRTVGANAAIYIELPLARDLSFESPTYIGTIEENNVILAPIIMNVGYGDDINFSLSGDYATYFNISHAQNQISIIQSTPLPQDVISSEDFLILTLSASGEFTETASAVVVLEIVKLDTNTPVFSQSIYVGSYSGMNVEIGNISLVQGYDTSVSFRLDGEHSQYFDISNTENNNIIVTLATIIPEELVLDEKVLLFDLIADKPLTVGANAVIAIRSPPELTDLAVMKFAQNTYIGSIENNIISLDIITLESGYNNGTEFTLTGEYASYFTLASSENVITISILDPIPEEVMQTNRYLVLELEAERFRAVSAVTSIIIHLVLPEVDQPIFAQPYYTGVYTEDSGLQFEQEIILTQGFDETVTFSLDGDSSEWFTLSTNGNSITLQVNGSILSQIIDTNHQLIFIVVAYKVGAPSGQTVISIELPKEIDPVILRFGQNSYVGRIESGELQPPAITLLVDNEQELQLTIFGEYANYFTLLRETNNVLLQLSGALPSETEESFIILNIEASNTNAITGYTTVVIDIVKDPVIVRPMFEQAYYIGEYSEQNGLLFEHNIQLIDGFDETVFFTLEGDDAQWFEINYGENKSLSLTLNYNGTLPVEEGSQLIFSIVAHKLNSLPGRATIVILSDYPQTVSLLFSQIFYKGTVENGNLTIEAITLDGYSADTNLSLTGDYVNYFQLLNQDGSLSIELLFPLPNDVINSNTVLILTLEAAASTTTAQATIVIELQKDEASSLAFEEAYYVGSYTESSGLLFDSQIRLASGYEESVSFYLEGDDAQWFVSNQTENSIYLQLAAPISQEVLLSRRQLIFVIVAEKPGSVSIRASILIELLDEITNDLTFLLFESRSYVGSIKNVSLVLEPINLYMGYSENVEFSLSGALSYYFTVTNDGALVSMHLEREIPDDLLPTNGLTLLELQASAPDSVSGYTVVIFEFIQQEITEPIFSSTYYTGSYSVSGGLAFDETISLSEGYNDEIEFDLQGEGIQWFGLQREGNNVSIVLTNPIPNEVLESNQQIILVINANKPGTAIARATVIIRLLDDNENWTVLRFEKNTYLGSIQNDTIILDQIQLSQGYTANVTFTLNGDESQYFELILEEGAVTILLRNNITEEAIPTNRIILLEIEASAQLAYSAYTTIVLEIVQTDDETIITQMIFSEPYYSGSYFEATGLIFDNNFSLAQGYDTTVEFDLEGEQSQWFGLQASENLVTLTLVSPIPPAVILNNQQLIFIILAQKNGTAPARATIVISLVDDISETTVLGFNKISYIGSIENEQIDLESVILTEGYNENVSFMLHGELANLFILSSYEETVTITLSGPIPVESIPGNGILVLEIQASAPQSISAYATIVIEVVTNYTVLDDLIFSEVYYTGEYTEDGGLAFGNISLSQGYDENVIFSLGGDQSQWFSLQDSGNIVSLILSSPIPSAVLANNQQLIFIITAGKPGSSITRATIIISLIDEIAESTLVGFNKVSYLGSIENDQINLEPIIVSEGYNENVTLTLNGELVNWFTISTVEEVVTITLSSPIPAESLPANRIIVLDIQASTSQSVSAYATIIFEVLRDDVIVEDLIFSEVYYTGKYTEEEGLAFESIFLSQGFDENITFALEGEQSQWFGVQALENVVTLAVISPIPSAVILNNQQLIFLVTADKLECSTAKATIIISLPKDLTEAAVLGFNKISYLGSIDNDQVILEPITLSEGYNENVSFTIHGQFSNYFTISSEEGIVTITLQTGIPEDLLTNRIILLEIQASALQFVSAYATVVFEVINLNEELIFTKLYYVGQYTDQELIFNDSISLSQGFDETVEYSLEGENSQWFSLVVSDNSVTLSVSNIPQEILDSHQNLIISIIAEKPGSATARAVIIISILADGVTTPGASFERALYDGVFRTGHVQHEAITLSGYNGTEIQVFGIYAELFVATVSEGSVTVEGVSSVNFTPDVVYVALELRASAAATVLLLDVEHEDVDPPTVTFGSTSYSIRTDVTQAGFIGRVEATASNGETVSYSLLTQDGHLSQRISVNQDGELHLSAPANSGVYNFEVVAMTIFSNVSGSAVVQLTVDVITVCGDDKVVPPLIILDRDEEEPHRNLVIMNEEHEGCRYSLTSRWPTNQTWLYVDDIGLHANAIDREDTSIAFMALSQIQVELLLECDSDINRTMKRNKRSVSSSTGLNNLGPYDYGDSNWILTDTILYNSRRTMVNLIVNDINDNYPIFVGKDNEPIVVGYPIPELEERVSPRALIKLEATDADVGENAALVYWSSDEVLAVSPSSGLVHVRQNARLEDSAFLSVFATDQNGQGLSGNLTLMVKLLDVTNIAVVTIKDAFLEDEIAILENLSDFVGYEVKALRATVVSDDTITNENASRRKRDVTTYGASLQIYVYGLIEREPVHVDRLTDDLTNESITTVNITRTVSLEDHLEEMRESSGRDTGLLVATIVLSVLLFILIVVLAAWLFLKWWKERNYEKFKDESSVASSSLDIIPGDVAKPQPEVMPRLNIEELIKSERRLQERLEAPDITVLPSSSKWGASLPSNTESAVTVPMPDAPSSIVIQDKLKVGGDESEDEDEFGERKKSRRKSVVTFNENVEKIIHVEQTSDDESSVHEVYKF